jgi:hypothetical protein
MHPVWKEAALDLSRRVESDGYGFLVSMDELYAMLDAKMPRAMSFWKDVKRHQFDFLEKVEELKRELLHEHNICFYNVRGKGYQALPPDEQVSKGWERQHEKVRKHLRKSLDILANVDTRQLSADGQKNRDRNINRTVFIMSAANKRKIPTVERKKIA